MREATESDLDFLAGCYVKIACHMKAGEQDLYIARLPETPDDTIRNHVARYVGREDALTLLEEIEGSPVACLLASIGSSSFSASRLGKSGHIAVCWVEPANRCRRHRGQAGQCHRRLVSAKGSWCRRAVVYGQERISGDLLATTGLQTLPSFLLQGTLGIADLLFHIIGYLLLVY